MPQVVNHPQLGRINFPDEMSPDDVRAALSRLDEQIVEQSKPYRAAETMRSMPVAGGGQIYPTPTPQEAARGLATGSSRYWTHCYRPAGFGRGW